MVKGLVLLLSLLFTLPSFANVDEDVSKCLSQSSTAAGAKTSCVQSAIKQEENNQVTNLFQLYTRFVSQQLNSGGGGGGASAPPPTGPGGAATGGLLQGGMHSPPPAPAPIAPPAKTTAPPSLKYY